MADSKLQALKAALEQARLRHKQASAKLVKARKVYREKLKALSQTLAVPQKDVNIASNAIWKASSKLDQYHRALKVASLIKTQLFHVGGRYFTIKWARAGGYPPHGGEGEYDLSGKVLTVKGQLITCSNGWHACVMVADSVRGWMSDEAWLIEVLSPTKSGACTISEGSKVCARSIRFLKKLTSRDSGALIAEAKKEATALVSAKKPAGTRPAQRARSARMSAKPSTGGQRSAR